MENHKTSIIKLFMTENQHIPLMTENRQMSFNTHNRKLMTIPIQRTSLLEQTPTYKAKKLFNFLSQNINNKLNLNTFKTGLK